MSKFFENNKQIIHIATEIVVLIGLTFYFSQQNRTLRKHIEDLAQRIEDQEDVIKKLEDLMKQQGFMLSQLHNWVQRQSSEPPREMDQPNSTPIRQVSALGSQTLSTEPQSAETVSRLPTRGTSREIPHVAPSSVVPQSSVVSQSSSQGTQPRVSNPQVYRQYGITFPSTGTEPEIHIRTNPVQTNAGFGSTCVLANAPTKSVITTVEEVEEETDDEEIEQSDLDAEIENELNELDEEKLNDTL